MSALGKGEVEVRRFTVPQPHGGQVVVVATGPSTEHERPILGEQYHQPRHRVEVYVSPKGRSVRIWLDGVELRA